MAQHFRALVLPALDSLGLLVTPALRNLTPPSGLHKYLHAPQPHALNFKILRENIFQLNFLY